MLNCKHSLMRPVDFVDQIYKNQLQLNLLTWHVNKQLQLLESIEKNYPIGSIILGNNSNYILDGNQRIGTIYNCFSKDIYNNFKMFYDLQLKKFTTEINLNTIPTNCFFNTYKFIKTIEPLNSSLQETAKQIANHFLDYCIPTIHITNATIEDVERINGFANDKN